MSKTKQAPKLSAALKANIARRKVKSSTQAEQKAALKNRSSFASTDAPVARVRREA